MEQAAAITPDFERYGEIVSPIPRIYPAADGSLTDGVPSLPDPIGSGQKAIDFLTRFKWAEGRAAGKHITEDTLAPYQAQLIRAIFGHVDAETGTRIISNVFFSCARKNAKSSTCALLALCLLASTREAKGEILLAAGSAKQASRLFDLIEGIAKTDEGFWSSIRSRRFPVFELRHTETDCGLKVVASEAERVHGLSPHVVLFDEIGFNGGEAGRRLLSALRTGFGARRNPLLIQLSTTPDVPLRDGDIYEQAVRYDERVKSGEVDDRRYLGITYFTDPDADLGSEDVWRAANPGIGYSLSLEEIREEHQRAVINSGSESEAQAFAALRLNQIPKSSLANGIIPGNVIGKIETGLGLEDLAGADAVCLGIDLGGSEDISAITALARFGDTYRAFSLGWLGSGAYARHRHKAPLDKFRAAGVLVIVDGDLVTPGLIASEAIDIAATLGCSDVAIDPAMATTVTQMLEEAGVTVHFAKQGSMSMSAPILTLQALAHEGKLQWPDDGLLTWATNNAVLLSNTVGFRIAKPSESGQDPRKIDPLAALLNALQWHIAIGDTLAGSPVAGKDNGSDAVDPWLEPEIAANIRFRGTASTGLVGSINLGSGHIDLTETHDPLGSVMLAYAPHERVAL